MVCIGVCHWLCQFAFQGVALRWENGWAFGPDITYLTRYKRTRRPRTPRGKNSPQKDAYSSRKTHAVEPPVDRYPEKPRKNR
jgi:hypothetical protein